MTRKQAEARVVRAAMRWNHWQERTYPNYVGQIAEFRNLRKACAALARKEKK